MFFFFFFFFGVHFVVLIWGCIDLTGRNPHQISWIWILAPAVTVELALGKFLSLSVSQFLYLWRKIVPVLRIKVNDSIIIVMVTQCVLIFALLLPFNNSFFSSSKIFFIKGFWTFCHWKQPNTLLLLIVII